MRTLTLCIGNTSLLGGVFRGGRLAPRFRLPIREPLTREEFAPLLARHVGREPIDRAVLCSVVPAHTRFVVRLIRRLYSLRPLLLSHDAPHGLKIAYREPHRLGLDRLAAAIGARAEFPDRNILTIDFGTATTVTALRRDGAIAGGAILPGLSLWGDMLAQRTAQLPRIKIRRAASALGRSPEAAIESGVFFGHAGAVRELVQRVGREAFGRARPLVLGTGGHAPLFAREKLFTVHAPDLILAGLYEFATRFDAARTPTKFLP